MITYYIILFTNTSENSIYFHVIGAITVFLSCMRQPTAVSILDELKQNWFFINSCCNVHSSWLLLFVWIPGKVNATKELLTWVELKKVTLYKL